MRGRMETAVGQVTSQGITAIFESDVSSPFTWPVNAASTCGIGVLAAKVVPPLTVLEHPNPMTLKCFDTQK